MYLGIEIGGTKLQIGVGAADGMLRGLWREHVDVQAGPEGIRRQILRAVPELLARASLQRSEVVGIGIGFGGPVDDATASVIKSHQIEGWDNFPLAGWVAEMLGWPAVLGNDADLAGLAEARFGAGRGLSPIFYITVGSGIGGGFVVDGQVYRGCGQGAAEIGHLPMRDPDDPAQRLQPLELLASGWSIQQRARKRLREETGLQSVILDFAGGVVDQVTTEHIARAAAAIDPLACAILTRALERLSEGICQMIALLCPRRIVIGGGVSLIGDELFFNPLRLLVAANVFRPFAHCYEIVPAALGEEVVVHGALALAQSRLDHSPSSK